MGEASPCKPNTALAVSKCQPPVPIPSCGAAYIIGFADGGQVVRQLFSCESSPETTDSPQKKEHDEQLEANLVQCT